MKKLTSLLLALTLWTSCSAQNLKMIPVHFHNLTKAPISHAQLDDQITELNRVYSLERTPFQFQLASIDQIDTRSGGKRDLNVRITPLDCDFSGCKYGESAFPWDAPFEPDQDKIDLDPTALPSGTASGIVLAHEIGHWLGLYHTSGARVKEVANCMDVPNMEISDPICHFTPAQLNRMSVLFGIFRQ